MNKNCIKEISKKNYFKQMREKNNYDAHCADPLCSDKIEEDDEEPWC